MRWNTIGRTTPVFPLMPEGEPESRKWLSALRWVALHTVMAMVQYPISIPGRGRDSALACLWLQALASAYLSPRGGQMLGVSRQDGTAMLYQIQDLAPPMALLTNIPPAVGLLLSPDGQTVAIAEVTTPNAAVVYRGEAR